MSVFNRREFLIAAGLGGAAVLLPRWLKRQGGGSAAETAAAESAAQAAPAVDQEWVFDLSFPAWFPVLPAVIDPTPTPTPTASATPTATATAVPTATGTPTPTATPDPLDNKIYLPLVAKETNP